jgi:nitrous oxidase accessory protein NosD
MILKKNNIQLNGCECKAYNLSEPPHNWDNGKVGNCWSDYNGTDANHDGIGDTPYTIDIVDRDRFPLMQSPVKPPAPASKVPVETIVLGVSLPAALAAAVFTVKVRRKRKSS